MHVTISNIEFEVGNTAQGVDELFSRIDTSMKDFGVYFSHLIVDGVEVTDAPQDYVTENVTGISDVEVIFLTANQYFEQVMSVLDTFLEKATPTLKEVADEFYGRPDDDVWFRFEACINGINSLLGIINSMISAPEFFGETDEISALGESIGLHLDNLKQAATLNDYTLMADIMNYELVDFLEKLHGTVQKMVRRHNNVAH
jgi:hypothetical protein